MNTTNQNDFAEQLLTWYDRNRRFLPWREDPAPYHVWLSEIMLQQTRVEAVLDYYARFLNELPDIAALAAADDDRLMKLWEGLGYYSRVRSMKKAAVLVMEKYNGALPSTAAELQKLPGIGPYTAAAIASIAFGEPVPSVDGNLLRVFARLTCYTDNNKLPAAKTAAEHYYSERMPAGRPGSFNQALMDVGATICLPNGAPKCPLCPFQKSCRAHAGGIESELPVLPAKAKRPVEQKTVFLITDGRRLLLDRRPEKGLLAGLYEFPNIEGCLSKDGAAQHMRSLGFAPSSVVRLGTAKHVFTHKEWHMVGFAVRVGRFPQNVAEAPAEGAGLPLEPGALFPATAGDLRNRYSIPSAFSAFFGSAKELLSDEQD